MLGSLAFRLTHKLRKSNSLQELAEASRLGIPVLAKSNARNHIDPDARAGINESNGAFTGSW